jgi:hypothetical protein
MTYMSRLLKTGISLTNELSFGNHIDLPAESSCATIGVHPFQRELNTVSVLLDRLFQLKEPPGV